MRAYANQLQSQNAIPGDHSSQRSGRAAAQIQPSPAAFAHPHRPWHARPRHPGCAKPRAQELAAVHVDMPPPDAAVQQL